MSIPHEIVVEEDPVTGTWRFELGGYRVEVERIHGLVKVDGHIHSVTAVLGLQDVEDLAGNPLEAIGNIIALTDTAKRQLALPTPAGSGQAMDALLASGPHHGQSEPPRVAPEPRSSRPQPHRSKRPTPESNPRRTSDGVEDAAFNTTAAAQYLGLSPRTLETKRTRGGGPEFEKLGRRVVYRKSALDKWRGSRQQRSTSDQAGAPKR